MPSYAEIRSQIAALEREAEAARQNELAGAIGRIHELMATHGITLADLATSETKAGGKARRTVPARYRDPVSGATWTGHGHAPKWLGGRSKDDFLID